LHKSVPGKENFSATLSKFCAFLPLLTETEIWTKNFVFSENIVQKRNFSCYFLPRSAVFKEQISKAAVLRRREATGSVNLFYKKQGFSPENSRISDFSVKISHSSLNFLTFPRFLS